MLAAFFLTRRREGTKTQSFFETNLLIYEKCVQPFEPIELIEPFEQPSNLPNL